MNLPCGFDQIPAETPGFDLSPHLCVGVGIYPSFAFMQKQSRHVGIVFDIIRQLGTDPSGF